jgi:AcrR family transcriptional regulator
LARYIVRNLDSVNNNLVIVNILDFDWRERNLDIAKIARKAYVGWTRFARGNNWMDQTTARPYHHGDLRAALLAAAEAMLERDGIQALTLRATARAAGVSHAAPAHHFGDLTGLLSELAAVGYRHFATDLTRAMETAGDDARARMRAMGHAYVQFARTYPGMFMLMFRSECLDVTRPALREASDAAGRALRDAIVARAGGGTMPPAQIVAEAAAAWSLVHGFAVLLLDGRLEPMISALPGGRNAETLLDAIFTVESAGRS